MSNNAGSLSNYIDVNWVKPGSVIVERQFSGSKLVYSDLRKSMTPINLEMLMFLKANRSLWDLALVGQACSGV